MFRDGGVVGAEELLNLDACQAAILSSLSQPRHSLRAQQSTGSECKWEHLTTKAQSHRGMQEMPKSKWTVLQNSKINISKKRFPNVLKQQNTHKRVFF